MPVVRVGFILGDVGWMGGVNYFRSLLAAIQTLPNAKIHPVVFVGFKSDASHFQGYAEIIRTKALDRYSLPWWIGKFIERTGIGRNYIIYLLLRKNNIHLASHYDGLWRGCKIPSLGWIPDFQHIHLRQFFTSKELLRRDFNISRQIKKCSALLLSSQDSLKDFRIFCPEKLIQTYVLNFTPNPLLPKELLNYSAVAQQYNLTKPWLHLPNQFWAHKNHSIVIEALNLLKLKGVDVLVVCTGSTDDYRNPQYFQSLMKRVHEYGLEENFIVLGVLPYRDMMSILHHSIATINPSLFEGWSTTVEESKAMGKKIILSNIAVHREQNPQRGVYFPPDNAEELAALIFHHNLEYDATLEEKCFIDAAELTKERFFQFGTLYEDIALKIVKSHVVQ